MEAKKITCPYCHAPVTKIGIDLGKVTCEYCNQSFIVQKGNETHLEKFFRVMHEEQKRQIEFQNTEEYKKKKEQDDKEKRKTFIIFAIFFGFAFFCLIMSTILDLIK